MPAIGFICPGTRDRVPFDHFDTCTHGTDGRPAASPWLARYMAKRAKEDIRHTSLDLTTTRCMGCPRETYLKAMFDYHINPEKKASADRGSALHEHAARNCPPGWITEHTDPVSCTVTGTLFDIELSGLIDTIVPGSADGSPWEIIDWKFPKDGSIFYRGKFLDSYEIQLNINRLLLAQQPWAIDKGYDPDTVRLTIWDHACGKKDGPAALPIKHLTETELLHSHPFGGAYTLEEIVQVHRAMTELHVEHNEPIANTPQAESVAAEIPMVGEHGMMNGAKCELYCDVQEVCHRIARTHGCPGAEEGEQ